MVIGSYVLLSVAFICVPQLLQHTPCSIHRCYSAFIPLDSFPVSLLAISVVTDRSITSGSVLADVLSVATYHAHSFFMLIGCQFNCVAISKAFFFF